MNLFEKLLHSLEGEMTEPTNYGWFHLMFVAIVILTTVVLCTKFRNSSDDTLRRIVLICWIVIVVLEIYKQLIFSFECDENGIVTWDYQWYAFPYQLCSTPLYVLPFIAFMKDSKIRDCFIAYISSFSVFVGVAVFFYPNDVFVETIGINIQTMIHHGLQIVLGVFLFVYFRNRVGIKHYLKGIPVFAVLVTVAIVLNEWVYASFTAQGIDETFNMFYISRHFDCTLPVLSSIYPLVHFVVFSLIYILGFVIVSSIIYFLQIGIMKLVYKIKGKV